ncbi:MAG: DNA polymerase ligase N-terminal domain-containing protein [Nanobdellota archaeon]
MPIFVIQEHNASHLHWDFRLEINGVLKSWAIPKKPPKEKNLKRLAIQVPDHDLDYADFEGNIEEGYGKGTVKIWDKGNYKLENMEENKIVIFLYGNKLNGKYILLKINYGNNEKQKKRNWLFFRTE